MNRLTGRTETSKRQGVVSRDKVKHNLSEDDCRVVGGRAKVTGEMKIRVLRRAVEQR